MGNRIGILLTPREVEELADLVGSVEAAVSQGVLGERWLQGTDPRDPNCAMILRKGIQKLKMMDP